MSEHTDQPDEGPVVLINVVEIPAERVEGFLDGFHKRAQILGNQPGFRDIRLHFALSAEARFQLVIVAHWDSQEKYDAAVTTPEFHAGLAAAGEDPRMRQVTPNDALYRVIAGYHRQPGGPTSPISPGA